jgi:hypothetical protein
MTQRGNWLTKTSNANAQEELVRAVKQNLPNFPQSLSTSTKRTLFIVQWGHSGLRRQEATKRKLSWADTKTQHFSVATDAFWNLLFVFDLQKMADKRKRDESDEEEQQARQNPAAENEDDQSPTAENAEVFGEGDDDDDEEEEYNSSNDEDDNDDEENGGEEGGEGDDGGDGDEDNEEGDEGDE